MPTDIRDESPQVSIYNDEGIGIADELDDSAQHSQISLDDPDNSHPSSPPASTTDKEKNAPLHDEEPTMRRTRKRHPGIFALPSHSTSTAAGVSTGMCNLSKYFLCPHACAIPADYRAYAPSPPFEEAGPTSCIWRAYLDESLVSDTDKLGNQRGQVNILLVFVSQFRSCHDVSPEFLPLVGRTVLCDCHRIHCAICRKSPTKLYAIVGPSTIRSDQYATCPRQRHFPQPHHHIRR